MPDIDVDFCFERRQEVIDYVTRKYGKDRVVQIVTFGTLAARGVIRDVGRVLDMPYAQVDSIAKMIPNELNITIDKALTMNHELKELYESDDQIHYLIDMSRRLEGLPPPYVHARGRRRDQPEAGGRVCPAFQSQRRNAGYPVYNDDAGGTGASEDGFPGPPHADGDSECGTPGGAKQSDEDRYGPY